MPVNLYYQELMTKERQQEFAIEAERMRLIKLARANRPDQGNPGMEKLANWLIRTGEHIKVKYGAPLPATAGQGCGAENRYVRK